MERVLICDYVHPVLITGLRDLGFFTQYAPEIERGQVLAWIPGCAGAIINTKTVADAAFMDAGRDLKWIARLGSGLDIIDMDEASGRGIRIISTPQANANAVAEHAVGMLLGLVRNICIADNEVRAGHWIRERNRGMELDGKTIGIIGFGNNGSAFAAKFAGWNVRIVAYDKYKSNYASDQSHIRESDLDQVLAQSDIISLHVPLTAETKHMVDADFLSRCKPGCILINTSRGKVVDTKALLEVLTSGHLRGACLDVLENEKPESFAGEEKEVYDALFALRNVVLTPHIAGWTIESKRKIAEAIVRSVGSTGKTRQL